MHITVVHGYLLRGTGSNLFTQNLCREFCRLGHDVALFCQESEPQDFDFISSAYAFPPDNGEPFLLWERETPYAGKCEFYRPNLDGLLPVYVYDDYEGFTVKEYPNLTLEELEGYLECNRRALSFVFSRRLPELILSQHTIMQPIYAARALRGLAPCRHYMTVHGSCLNFSVRRSALLKEYAREAIAACDRIICVSEEERREFIEFFAHDQDVESKSTVIPVGVDVEKFVPLSSGESKQERIGLLAEALLTLRDGREGGGRTAEEKDAFSNTVAIAGDIASLAAQLATERYGINEWEVDSDDARRLLSINWEQDQVVIYYGKFLWTKGLHLLLAAAPLILMRHPGARFVLVGFGSQRAFLEALLAALEHGKRDLFAEMLSNPEALDPEADPSSSLYFAALLGKLIDHGFADSYFHSAREHISDRVIFTGFLDHERLKDLLPCVEVAVAPSIFPEAFGLVAVEALSSGVIPLLTNHSGFSGVIRDVVDEFSDTFDENLFKPLFLDGELVLNLASNISVFLDYYSAIGGEERQGIRRRAREIAVSKYSWGAIARSYLAL
jgi:glycosyltransferase involved in cell wall biosynthesis